MSLSVVELLRPLGFYPLHNGILRNQARSERGGELDGESMERNKRNKSMEKLVKEGGVIWWKSVCCDGGSKMEWFRL